MRFKVYARDKENDRAVNEVFAEFKFLEDARIYAVRLVGLINYARVKIWDNDIQDFIDGNFKEVDTIV